MICSQRKSQIYQPILPYQTRLMRLLGAGGNPNSPLTCELRTADLLHASIEGLGVRGVHGGDDYLAPYAALSYAWGISEASRELVCNNVALPITSNLSHALQALRSPDKVTLNLWVDAICIDQQNDEEKSRQVANMLMIYQKATFVVAWLGTAHEGLEQLLRTAEEIVKAPVDESGLCKMEDVDVPLLLRCLNDLYGREYFKRMWILQEVFAARKLYLQCDTRRFMWARLLSNPAWFVKLSHMPSVENLTDEGGPSTAINATKARFAQTMTCFQRFSSGFKKWPSSTSSLVDTLISTGGMEASRPQDYVYAVLGLSSHPTRPMPLRQWLVARQYEYFIPIDYSADVPSIMASVTWSLLMHKGLIWLAKYGRLARAAIHGQAVPGPSWAIDWRDVAKHLSVMRWEHDTNPAFSSAFNADYDIATRNSQILANFRKDNMQAAFPIGKLAVRGTVAHKFYADGNRVYEKILMHRRLRWKLGFSVDGNCLIVSIEAFISYDDNRYTPGLWLLRSNGYGEFRIMACLLRTKRVALGRNDRDTHGPVVAECESASQETCWVGVEPVADFEIAPMKAQSNHTFTLV